MWLISAVGAGLICAVLAVVLGQYRPEYRTLVSLGAGVLILMLVLENILPAVQQIESVFSLTGMDLNYGEILMKAVGICFFTQLASDVCRDAGEGSAASKIEFGRTLCGPGHQPAALYGSAGAGTSSYQMMGCERYVQSQRMDDVPFAVCNAVILHRPRSGGGG